MTTGVVVAKDAEKVEKRYTNVRLYEADAEDLSWLASSEGITVAEAYHRRHAKKVREERIEKAEKELRRLKGG